MDEHVIDLSEYLGRGASARDRFGVWGGEGVRARFALPAWRALQLVGARRGGLVWLERMRDEDLGPQGLTLVPATEPAGALRVDPKAGPSPAPYFVLDLSSDQPRTDFSAVSFPRYPGRAPALHVAEGSLTIHLCASETRVWYLVLDEIAGNRGELDQDEREQLLFFAGECAGLLIHHGLAAEEETLGEGEGSPGKPKPGPIPDSPSGA